jgi:hypothetical protein
MMVDDLFWETRGKLHNFLAVDGQNPNLCPGALRVHGLAETVFVKSFARLAKPQAAPKECALTRSTSGQFPLVIDVEHRLPKLVGRSSSQPSPSWNLLAFPRGLRS